MKRSYLKPKGMPRTPSKTPLSALKSPFRGRKQPKLYRGGKKVVGRNSKIWSLRKADTEFSKEIRERDGKCMHPHCICGNKMLQCSHYHGRATKSTRFDPDNCITLGWRCHYKDKLIGFEYQKQTKEKHGFDGEYTKFMRQWLGEKRFNELNARAKQSIKQNLAITNYQVSKQK